MITDWAARSDPAECLELNKQKAYKKMSELHTRSLPYRNKRRLRRGIWTLDWNWLIMR